MLCCCKVGRRVSCTRADDSAAAARTLPATENYGVLLWVIKIRITSADRKEVSKAVRPKAIALSAEALKIARTNLASQTRAGTRPARDANSQASRNAVVNKAAGKCRTTRIAARANRAADRLPVAQAARVQDPATKKRRTDSTNKKLRVAARREATNFEEVTPPAAYAGAVFLRGRSLCASPHRPRRAV
jgi:hypothetical protein